MTMNPELQPEKRTDKNGNVVTRWVRSLTKRNKETTGMPAPELKMAETSNPYYQEYNRYLEQSAWDEASGYGYHDSTGPDIDYEEVSRIQKEINCEIERVTAILAPKEGNYRRGRNHDPELLRENLSLLIRYSPETLEDVIASSNEGILEKEFWAKFMSEKTLHPTASRETDEAVERCLNHYRICLGTVSCMNRLEAEGVQITGEWDTPSIWKWHSTVDSILEAHSGENKKFSKETAEATALFSYIGGLQYLSPFNIRDTPSLRYEANKKDIDYFSQNLDAVYRVMPELVQRGVKDAGLVRVMVESPSSALNEGEL